MPPAAKTTSTKHKFIIDYSRPAADGVFDGADFESFSTIAPSSRVRLGNLETMLR
ncbi:hypothetical protein J3R83DRAFT_6720 [Lanmaoa asiatica]|nr:hypothetical protein J3R83DRAFT_6720 [Lanmaoa asiatica]